MTLTAVTVGPQGYSGHYPRCKEQSLRVRLDTRIVLATWRMEHLVASAETVVGELFANAVTHGRGSPRVTVCRKDTLVEVSVQDESSELPQIRRARPDDESGRGLLIVDAFSASWGVESMRVGKRVWALLNA